MDQLKVQIAKLSPLQVTEQFWTLKVGCHLIEAVIHRLRLYGLLFAHVAKLLRPAVLFRVETGSQMRFFQWHIPILSHSFSAISLLYFRSRLIFSLWCSLECSMLTFLSVLNQMRQGPH